MRNSTLLLLWPLVIVAPARVLWSQSYLLHTFSGTNPNNYEQMGEVVAAAGDFDGDGFADVLVGAIHQANAGRVLLYSGRTGGTLRSWGGAVLDGHFGAAVAALGDIDGDGVTDVLVGAPSERPTGLLHQGHARVFSGATGAARYAYAGSASLDFFGQSVAALGDIDRDGVPDFAIGAPGADPGGVSEMGEVTICSGASGRVVRVLQGQGRWHWFGHSLAAAGDLDRDGVSDLVVGAPVAGTTTAAYIGHAHVISGASGNLLRTFTGQSGDRLGLAVASAGDLDGDGVADLLVGAPQRDTLRPPVGAGYVVVFSGAHGGVLRTWSGRAPGDGFGYSLAALGDVDGDGVPEVLVGAPWVQAGVMAAVGEVRIYSGASGVELAAVSGASAHDYFGTSVARAGDVDADGLLDFVVGAPQALPEPLHGPGYASVHSLTGIPAGAVLHPPACAGSGGHEVRLRTYGGAPRVGNGAFGASVQRALGGSAAALFLAPRADPRGFPFAGCTLYLLPPLHALAHVPLAGTSGLPGAGYRFLPLPIPAAAALAGVQIPLQAAVADPGGPAGWLALSAALVFTIAP